MTRPAQTRLPLFYRKPELLTPAQHGDLRIKPGGYAFAQAVNAVPVAAVEFGNAMRHYPIVFAAGDNYPVAILGLDRANRFVEIDAWQEKTYIPAYVRRYPFVFANRSEDSFILAIDREADNVVSGGEEGEPLFQDGKPTAMVENILAFCRDFHGAHIQTDAFVEALVGQDLLVQNHAAAKLVSGRAMTLSGFKVVDRQKFEALADDVILAWHRKGWLALVHFHLLSLERFADLLAREESINPASGGQVDEDVLTTVMDEVAA